MRLNEVQIKTSNRGTDNVAHSQLLSSDKVRRWPARTKHSGRRHSGLAKQPPSVDAYDNNNNIPIEDR